MTAITITNSSQQGTFRSLPTVWNGTHFRSRTEARHAVVFAALGISYLYEPVGYRFPDGTCYRCDFRIDAQPRWIGDGCWVEIKGKEPTVEEEHKAWLLAKYAQKAVYILFGDCRLPVEMSRNMSHSGGYVYLPDGSWDNFQWIYQCPTCKKNGIGLFGQSVASQCGCPRPTVRENDYNPIVVAAYRTAQEMRFG